MSKPLPKTLEPFKQKVTAAFHSAQSRHESDRRRWEHYYRLYRSYRDWKRSYDRSKPNDVDEVLRTAKRQFGEELFIPYVFSVIETTLPRMLSQNPKMLVVPRQPDLEDHIEPVRVLLDHQQNAIDYPLVLQDIAKDGLMYGLGIGKVCWEKKTRTRKLLLPPTYRTEDGPAWVEGEEEEVVFEGPTVEAVDPFDWIYDPTAHDMDSLRWCIHRTWRDNAYVRKQVAQGRWNLPARWKLEDLLDAGSSEKRDEVFGERERAAGFRGETTDRGETMHEVWEFHNGSEVIVLVDRHAVVVAGENPYWHGEMPFQIFRPTRVTHEMCGIGEAEAIEDLQIEMNELRTSRRDNARLVVQRPFAYFDGLVDPADIAFGPGIGIPTEGDPREVLSPIPLQDLPASSYSEEDRMRSDIERVTGIDDSSAGSGTGASETATGVQLVQAAANIRIQNKTKRLETETVKAQARQFVGLSQQHILEPVQVPGPPTALEADRERSWYSIGPEQLNGPDGGAVWDVEPEGGSMQPENVVQKRDDAQRMLTLFGQDPLIDPVKLREFVLENLGVLNPQSWLKPQEPEIPAHILEQAAQLLAQDAQAQGIPLPPDIGQQLVNVATQLMQQEQDQQDGGGQPQLPAAA